MDVWLTETYFDWLRSDCFSDPRTRNTFDGCLRLLHDIPFVWIIWSDEDRAGDALSFRQNDFLGFQRDLGTMDQQWLNAWSLAAPSVLEVLLGICRRWNAYFEDPMSYYFDKHLFRNLQLDRYPGRVISARAQTMIRNRLETWMFRQFLPNGEGSPFPIHQSHLIHDQREIPIWDQMNAYSAQHFQ